MYYKNAEDLKKKLSSKGILGHVGLVLNQIQAHVGTINLGNISKEEIIENVEDYISTSGYNNNIDRIINSYLPFQDKDLNERFIEYIQNYIALCLIKRQYNSLRGIITPIGNEFNINEDMSDLKASFASLCIYEKFNFNGIGARALIERKEALELLKEYDYLSPPVYTFAPIFSGNQPANWFNDDLGILSLEEFKKYLKFLEKNNLGDRTGGIDINFETWRPMGVNDIDQNRQLELCKYKGVEYLITDHNGFKMLNALDLIVDLYNSRRTAASRDRQEANMRLQKALEAYFKNKKDIDKRQIAEICAIITSSSQGNIDALKGEELRALLMGKISSKIIAQHNNRRAPNQRSGGIKVRIKSDDEIKSLFYKKSVVSKNKAGEYVVYFDKNDIDEKEKGNEGIDDIEETRVAEYGGWDVNVKIGVRKGNDEFYYSNPEKEVFEFSDKKLKEFLDAKVAKNAVIEVKGDINLLKKSCKIDVNKEGEYFVSNQKADSDIKISTQKHESNNSYRIKGIDINPLNWKIEERDKNHYVLIQDKNDANYLKNLFTKDALQKFKGKSYQKKIDDQTEATKEGFRIIAPEKKIMTTVVIKKPKKSDFLPMP